MNEQKAKIVFCRNEKHKGTEYPNVSFNFLGYTFMLRYCPTKNGLKLLTAACMSKTAKNEFRDKFRKFSIRKLGVWHWLNKKLIEWTMCNKKIGKFNAIRWLEQVYRT